MQDRAPRSLFTPDPLSRTSWRNTIVVISLHRPPQSLCPVRPRRASRPAATAGLGGTGKRWTAHSPDRARLWTVWQSRRRARSWFCVSSFLSGLSGAAVLTAVQVLLVVVALIVAPRNRRPAAALAWILLIALLPVIGIVLFAVMGSPKLPRSRRDNQRQISHLIEDRTKNLEDVDLDLSMPRWLPSVVRLNQTVGAMPLLAGNTVQLVTGFADQLAALVAAVDGARRHVHVEFYILSYDATTGPFFAALHHAVERGVTVRVLLDHLGSRPYPGYRKTRQELTRIGARWHLMLPVQPWRAATSGRTCATTES